jgi:hypothetical protein
MWKLSAKWALKYIILVSLIFFGELTVDMQTFFNTKFCVFLLDVGLRRIMNSHVKLLGYPLSPCRATPLALLDVESLSIFVSLYRVISEKATIFRSVSLSVSVKSCKI